MYEIIAQRGESVLLVIDESEKQKNLKHARVLDLDKKILYPLTFLESIVARGYWEEYTGEQNADELIKGVEDKNNDAAEKGGPGSGNWGHQGLSGVWGGSSPRGSRFSGGGGGVPEPKDKDSMNERIGKCYELSAKHVVDGKGGVLVHGFITDKIKTGRTIDHAWVEIDDKIHDPVMGKTFDKPVFYGIFGAEPTHRYNEKQVRDKILETGHWGPWHKIDQSKVNWWPDDEPPV